MKKAIVLLCAIFAVLLVSCTYSAEDVEAAREEGYEAGYEAGRKAGYDTGYDKGYEAGYAALKPVARPASGTVLAGREYGSGSELTIKADTDEDYVVLVKDRWMDYLAFYVRAGDTVTIGVPDRLLYVYFASGKEWYGYGKGLMFGEDTDYSKDDEQRDFTQYSYTYTLYPVTNGNFSESPSNENEFF